MKKIITVAALAMIAATSYALTATEAFIDAPSSIFPLLNNTSRLDMIDYYKAGLTDVGPQNAMLGQSMMTALTDETLTIKMTDASTVLLSVLPCGRDSVVMVVTTVKTPSLDSSVAFYDSSWQRLDDSRYFSRPTLDDWLADRNHRGDVEALVPFMLASLSYDPTTSTLTASNSLPEFLSEEVYSMIAPWMKRQLTYVWNGRKFAKQ